MKMLLTATEAANLLGLSRSKTYELIAAGRLASVRVDGCLRVRRVDLENFVANLSGSTESGVRSA